jgi:hypothetical protein
MGRVHISQSPLTHIFIHRERLKFDGFFRLYAFIWVLLLSGVGVYVWQSIEKSIDSYNNPTRRIILEQRDEVPFPPIVFCASNADTLGFSPARCSFSSGGSQAATQMMECDFVPTTLTLQSLGNKVQLPCGVLRGVRSLNSSTTTPASPPASLLQLDESDNSNQKNLLKSQSTAFGPSEVQSQNLLQILDAPPNILANRTIAQATYPSSIFRLHFNSQQAGYAPFDHVLFYVLYQKTTTENEKASHKYVYNPNNPNPVNVPRNVDAWTKLYPARTEEILMTLRFAFPSLSAL